LIGQCAQPNSCARCVAPRLLTGIDFGPQYLLAGDARMKE